MAKATTKASERDLFLTRMIDAPPALVFKAWTDPKHIVHWFTPKPWSTTKATVDLRVGGTFFTMMRSPEGEDFPNYGVFLEIAKNRRLVWTDAYTQAWKPSEKPFMTAALDFEEIGGKTKYSAHILHWSVADREEHEKMGFHEGWATAAEQLAAYLKEM